MSINWFDKRGSLTSIKDIPFEVKEILILKSHENVLRGLHQSPYEKRIIVLKGKIYDFSIDPNTFEKKEVILNTGDYVDIPQGWAHGFYSYEESEILYLLENKFNEDLDKNIYWNDYSLKLQLNFPKEDLIISEKDKNSSYYNKYDYYVLGAKGFLGSHCVNILKSQGYTVFESNERFENMNIIREQIIKSRAKYVICSAGISGKPTIDWCETHEKETYDVNYLGVLDLIRMTQKLNIHCTIFGSGLIYSGNKDNYTEDDIPDYYSKVYSKWRIELEKQILLYNNVLYLRIIYPVTLDGNPKCFLTKIVGRANNIHNVNVSLTIIPDLFKQISILSINNITGIFNFVNKGSINLVDLLSLYSNTLNRIVINVDNNNTNKRGAYKLDTTKIEHYINVSNVNTTIKLYLNNKNNN